MMDSVADRRSSPARSPSAASARDAFQETDITGITLPITKHNYLVHAAPRTSRRRSREAFHIARTGRPGPVLVDIPKDAQQAKAEFDWPDDAPNLPRLPADAAPPTRRASSAPPS